MDQALFRMMFFSRIGIADSGPIFYSQAAFDAEVASNVFDVSLMFSMMSGTNKDPRKILKVIKKNVAKEDALSVTLGGKNGPTIRNMTQFQVDFFKEFAPHGLGDDFLACHQNARVFVQKTRKGTKPKFDEVAFRTTIISAMQKGDKGALKYNTVDYGVEEPENLLRKLKIILELLEKHPCAYAHYYLLFTPLLSILSFYYYIGELTDVTLLKKGMEKYAEAYRGFINLESVEDFTEIAEMCGVTPDLAKMSKANRLKIYDRYKNSIMNVPSFWKLVIISVLEECLFEKKIFSADLAITRELVIYHPMEVATEIILSVALCGTPTLLGVSTMKFLLQEKGNLKKQLIDIILIGRAKKITSLERLTQIAAGCKLNLIEILTNSPELLLHLSCYVVTELFAKNPKLKREIVIGALRRGKLPELMKAIDEHKIGINVEETLLSVDDSDMKDAMIAFHQLVGFSKMVAIADSTPNVRQYLGNFANALHVIGGIADLGLRQQVTKYRAENDGALRVQLILIRPELQLTVMEVVDTLTAVALCFEHEAKISDGVLDIVKDRVIADGRVHDILKKYLKRGSKFVKKLLGSLPQMQYLQLFKYAEYSGTALFVGGPVIDIAHWEAFIEEWSSELQENWFPENYTVVIDRFRDSIPRFATKFGLLQVKAGKADEVQLKWLSKRVAGDDMLMVIHAIHDRVRNQTGKEQLSLLGVLNRLADELPALAPDIRNGIFGIEQKVLLRFPLLMET